MNSISGPAVDFRNMLWLTAALALVAAPHVQRLPLWVMLFAAALALWRLYLGSTNHPLPRKTLIMLVVLVAAAAVFLNYRTLFGRDAGVSLLVVMLALKLLETESRRDALLLILLAYFLIVTNFLYSQTIPTALYMLGCLWIVTAAMIACNYARSRPDYRTPLRSAALMLAQAAPLMLALFLLFPRATGPLWRLPQDAQPRIEVQSHLCLRRCALDAGPGTGGIGRDDADLRREAQLRARPRGRGTAALSGGSSAGSGCSRSEDSKSPRCSSTRSMAPARARVRVRACMRNSFRARR